MASQNNGLRLPPPWISPAAGMPDREVRPVIIVQRRRSAYDSDAQAYITAVETADAQALETGVKDAINAFVVGCKADGIWTAIKASCILAGARTLAGALVPVVGAAPTSFGTAGGWNYNRKTGLLPNGTDNYLNSNRANNSDPQNNNHNAVYVTTVGTANGAFIASDGTISGTNFLIGGQSNTLFSRSRSATGVSAGANPSPGLIGHSRSAAGSYTLRNNGASGTASSSSAATEPSSVLIFRRGSAATPSYSNHRIAFYSIGEALTLSLLEARLIALINTFAAVIQ